MSKKIRKAGRDYKKLFRSKKDTPEHKENQEKFNKLAHEIMEETKNVKIPLSEAKDKFDIEKLSINEFINKLTRKEDKLNYQGFRNVVELDLANWYHEWGFADLKDDSIFFEEGETYKAFHDFITKAV